MPKTLDTPLDKPYSSVYLGISCLYCLDWGETVWSSAHQQLQRANQRQKSLANMRRLANSNLLPWAEGFHPPFTIHSQAFCFSHIFLLIVCVSDLPPPSLETDDGTSLFSSKAAILRIWWTGGAMV